MLFSQHKSIIKQTEYNVKSNRNLKTTIHNPLSKMSILNLWRICIYWMVPRESVMYVARREDGSFSLSSIHAMIFLSFISVRWSPNLWKWRLFVDSVTRSSRHSRSNCINLNITWRIEDVPRRESSEWGTKEPL